MRWTHKAKIQKFCAWVPRGDVPYRQIQRSFGNLNSSPFRRLSAHTRLMAGLFDVGFEVEDARCVEVGTGHVPVLPVGFFLAGARNTTTVDLHHRLDLTLTRAMLGTIASSPDRVVEIYKNLVESEVLLSRLDLVRRYADKPLEFFEAAGIEYRAPADAGRMPDESGSFDLHFSVTVLEHVDSRALPAILTEAKRLLRRDGVAAHLIDPSDHFSHGDHSISAVNFLQFSGARWRRIAGNEFSYHNRLRACEFEALFEDAGLAPVRTDRRIDERSFEELEHGFPVDNIFAPFDNSELAVTSVDVFATRS